jgi:hypothetical protein
LCGTIGKDGFISQASFPRVECQGPRGHHPFEDGRKGTNIGQWHSEHMGDELHEHIIFSVFNFDPEPSNPAGEIAAESQTQR